MNSRKEAQKARKKKFLAPLAPFCGQAK